MKRASIIIVLAMLLFSSQTYAEMKVFAKNFTEEKQTTSSSSNSTTNLTTSASITSNSSSSLATNQSSSRCKNSSIKTEQDEKDSNETPCFITNITALSDSLVALVKDRPKSFSRNIVIYDIKSHRALSEIACHTATITALVTYPDYSKFVSGSADGEINIWDVATQELLQTINTGLQITSLAILPQNRLAIGLMNTTCIAVFDIKKGDLKRLLIGHEMRVNQLTTLPNGDLISCDIDNVIKIWDQKTLECTATMSCPKPVDHLASLRNNLIAIASCGNIYKYNLVNGNVEELKILSEDDATIGLSETPDGRLVIGYSRNKISLAILNYYTS